MTIAHPISGNIQRNLANIVAIVRQINLRYPDVVPFVPYYVDLLALDDNNPTERARGIANDTHLMAKADELWVYGDWKNSKGCIAEIELATKLNIPVYYKF